MWGFTLVYEMSVCDIHINNTPPPSLGWNPGSYYKLLTGFEANSSFVWPEDESVARSHRLRATDPFEGQTKPLLFKTPVYNCFVLHLQLLKIFLFSLFTRISIRCFQYPRPSSPRIWTMHQHCDGIYNYHMTYLTNENKASGQQFNSRQ